jgi:hypothetical protein
MNLADGPLFKVFVGKVIDARRARFAVRRTANLVRCLAAKKSV